MDPRRTIQITAASGTAFYLVAINQAGQWFNCTSRLYEMFNAGNWSTYVIALIEAVPNSGRFFGQVPLELPLGIALLTMYCATTPGSPASTDSQFMDGRGPAVYALDWTGTEIKSLAPLGPADSDLRQLSLPAPQDSLAIAQRILNELLEARAKLARNPYQSVSVDGQMFTARDASRLDDEIDTWHRKCSILSGKRRRFSALRLDQW